MIDCTTTTVNSFQMLNPIAPAPPGTNPLSYLESGSTFLTQGVQTKAIVFQLAKIGSYDIIESDIINTVDANPVNFSYEIIAQSSTGFTILLSGLPDTGNYKLQWTVQVPPS